MLDTHVVHLQRNIIILQNNKKRIILKHSVNIYAILLQEADSNIAIFPAQHTDVHWEMLFVI